MAGGWRSNMSSVADVGDGGERRPCVVVHHFFEIKPGAGRSLCSCLSVASPRMPSQPKGRVRAESNESLRRLSTACGLATPCRRRLSRPFPHAASRSLVQGAAGLHDITASTAPPIPSGERKKTGVYIYKRDSSSVALQRLLSTGRKKEYRE